MRKEMRNEVLAALCLVALLIICATTIVIALEGNLVARTVVAAMAPPVSALLGFVAGSSRAHD